ncbi:alpha/beta hydrolase family protein [Prosthecomicrobium sp. N25]|uniref:alpha/beta hydrolase family protein n=1 Tax=Prosthecomicrobium sp. N25 TaxID=3129254 RepID=UPI0030772E9E
MLLRAWLRERFEIGRHTLREVGRDVEPGACATERLTFETGAGEPVRGILLRPGAAAGPLPAVLYIHAHGGRYEIGAAELTDGRPALQSPLGPLLAGLGFAVLAIDLPCFGLRAGETESAAAKARLWHGRSLAGQMLGELAAAAGWLAARPDIDGQRIGAFGLSMGATFAYWLAAADERIAWIAHTCCYADFATLVETGAHDLHGIYLTVPGLLERTSTGAIAGLVAPRPQLVMVGDRDPLTPPTAVDRALAETLRAYEEAGAAGALELLRETETGHVETPAMRARLLDFLTARLAD